MNATFKFGKNTTMNLSAQFDTYLYDENGRQYNKMRWAVGKMPRLQSTGYSWSYQLNNEKLAKLFGHGSDEPDEGSEDENMLDGYESEDGYIEEDLDPTSIQAMQLEAEKKAKKAPKRKKGGDDGFLLWKVPWSLNFSYSMRFGYKDFNKEEREFNRGITHSATLSGNIQPTSGWNFSFNASYDFNLSKVTHMTVNCTRDMHCWALTASLNPMGQYASFNVNIAVKAAMLKDLKYEKTSVSRSNKIDWYND